MKIQPDNGSTAADTSPDSPYQDTPSIAAEIAWVAQAAIDRPLGYAADREFWLRKAALLDRIALREEADFAPEVAASAVTAAEEAARRLAEYDAGHSGPSFRGADLVTDADCREYVRTQYVMWCPTGRR